MNAMTNREDDVELVLVDGVGDADNIGVLENANSLT